MRVRVMEPPGATSQARRAVSAAPGIQRARPRARILWARRQPRGAHRHARARESRLLGIPGELRFDHCWPWRPTWATWPRTAKGDPDGHLRPSVHALQVEHQRPHLPGRKSREDVEPVDSRHEDAAGQGQAGSGRGHCGREEAPGRRRGLEEAGGGLGAPRHARGPGGPRRPGHPGADALQRGPPGRAAAARDLGPPQGRDRAAQGQPAPAQRQDRRGEAQEEHPGGPGQAGGGAGAHPADHGRDERQERLRFLRADGREDRGYRAQGARGRGTAAGILRRRPDASSSSRWSTRARSDQQLLELKAKMGVLKPGERPRGRSARAPRRRKSTKRKWSRSRGEGKA